MTDHLTPAATAENAPPAPTIPASEKSPLWVQCLDCGHAWVALYAPMELGKAASLLRNLHCQNCGASASRISFGQPAQSDASA